PHAFAGLLLKSTVAHAQHFIDKKDLRLDRRRDRERQADEHAGRIVAHGHIEELAQLAELGNALDFVSDAAARFALEITAIADVLPAAGLRLEAEHKVEQRTDLALHHALTAGGLVNARQQAQQRALAGAVGAN